MSKHPVCARTSITEHAQDSKHRMISSLHYENDPDIQIPKERDSNLSYLPLSPEPLPLPISPPLPTSCCYVQEVYSLCIFDHSYIVSHFLWEQLQERIIHSHLICFIKANPSLQSSKYCYCFCNVFLCNTRMPPHETFSSFISSERAGDSGVREVPYSIYKYWFVRISRGSNELTPCCFQRLYSLFQSNLCNSLHNHLKNHPWQRNFWMSHPDSMSFTCFHGEL